MVIRVSFSDGAFAQDTSPMLPEGITSAYIISISSQYLALLYGVHAWSIKLFGNIFSLL